MGLKFIFIKNAASIAWIDILEVHWNQKAPIQKYINHKKEYEIDNSSKGSFVILLKNNKKRF